MSPYFHVSMFPYLHMSMCPRVSPNSPCLHITISPCIQVSNQKWHHCGEWVSLLIVITLEASEPVIPFGHYCFRHKGAVVSDSYCFGNIGTVFSSDGYCSEEMEKLIMYNAVMSCFQVTLPIFGAGVVEKIA
jgi:hypothetical protein